MSTIGEVCSIASAHPIEDSQLDDRRLADQCHPVTDSSLDTYHCALLSEFTRGLLLTKLNRGGQSESPPYLRSSASVGRVLASGENQCKDY